MKTKFTATVVALAAMTLASCGGSGGSSDSRDQVRVVGSSTVFPFAKKVAEQLTLDNPGVGSPIVESTGTGAGFNLFCKGVGADTPDITMASRRIKSSEFADCQANGVADVVEVQVGLDGIAFASATDGIAMNLTPEIVYKALAANPYGKEQTAEKWSDIDPSLPDQRILVYGPPPTSGTRDALKELVLEVGCDVDPAMQELADTDEDKHAEICTEVRNDGAFVQQGEQDNLIVQKIETNPQAVGVFGFSYLEENADKVKGLLVNGVEPTYENIASFEYLGARPLYLYVKKAHVGNIPGLREFLDQWTKSWDADGPLAAIGLVSTPDDVKAAQLQRVSDLEPLTSEEIG